MKSITSFFANLRFKLFTARIEMEIYNRIFPHLESEKDCGYLFHSDAELQVQHQGDRQGIKQFTKIIERHAQRMPKAYGEAFRYIAYRDLKTRMNDVNNLKARVKMYERLAEQRIYPETCDPRFIAVHA